MLRVIPGSGSRLLERRPHSNTTLLRDEEKMNVLRRRLDRLAKGAGNVRNIGDESNLVHYLIVANYCGSIGENYNQNSVIYKHNGYKFQKHPLWLSKRTECHQDWI